MATFLPLLVLLVLGTIDASNALSVRQTLGSAAYEGARRAIRPDGTAQEVQSFVKSFLQEAGIAKAQVVIAPAEPDNASPGTWITVSVSVSSKDVALMDWTLLTASALESKVTMAKE